MTKLPKLTKKQRKIVRLLYYFRFLNRTQIQAFMGHKDPKTINLWLRDLRAKEYVEWIYSTDFGENTKPAVYYLRLNGVRYLRTLTKTDEDMEGKSIETPVYPPEELRKRYKEPTRSQTYIDRCTLIAECCLALERSNTKNEAAGKQLRHYYQTEADYLLERSYYHFILDSELIQPSLVFCKGEFDDGNETILDSYILEIFDLTLPRYRLRKRLSNYLQYLDEEGSEWEERTNTEKPPGILLVCPHTTDLIYAKRRMKKLITDVWGWMDEEEGRPRIALTTTEKLQESGVFDREMWKWV